MASCTQSTGLSDRASLVKKFQRIMLVLRIGNTPSYDYRQQVGAESTQSSHKNGCFLRDSLKEKVSRWKYGLE